MGLKYFLQYGIKFNSPQGSLLESEAVSKISVLVLLPNKGAPALDILEWKMNGEDFCPACGDKPRAVGLISDGTETSSAQWPWHVSLWKRGSSDMNYICGGSILNKKWIISAAHCMFSGGQPINENTLIIRIGSEKKLSAAYKQFTVQTLIIHENYDVETFENDVAMIKLKEILVFSGNFKAICYSQLGEIPEAAVGTAVGYGSTDKMRDHSDILRQVEIPIVDKEECLDSDMEFYRKYLFPGNFCAGEIGVLKGVCSGDSGGGFYVRVRNSWFLQGITSNTKISTSLLNPTCNYASFALFTNVTFYTGESFYIQLFKYFKASLQIGSTRKLSPIEET